MQSTEENNSESCYERDLSEEFFKARISYKQELTGEITLVMDRLNRVLSRIFFCSAQSHFDHRDLFFHVFWTVVTSLSSSPC